jgi:WD40 repeat protein
MIFVSLVVVNRNLWDPFMPTHALALHGPFTLKRKVSHGTCCGRHGRWDCLCLGRRCRFLPKDMMRIRLGVIHPETLEWPSPSHASLVHSIRHNSPLAEPTDKCLFSIWNRENREPAGVTNGSGDTSVAWNTQVAHILASSSADGSVAVWDLNSRQAWCEQTEHTGQAVADIS